MRPALQQLLRCSSCRGPLTCRVDVEDREHILEGALTCAACGRAYPVRGGIPRMVHRPLDGLSRTTAEVFGDEWARSPHLEQYYAQQLAAWIAPVGLDGFVGRRMLDAGCGKGRHTRIAAESGTALVVGLDSSSAVELAFTHTRHLANAHIVQADLLAPPFAFGAFDLVMSVGVLHHLPEPRQGVHALAPLLGAGGRLMVWVYGKEQNAWVERCRRWTASLRPPHAHPAVVWGLSAIPAAVLFIALRTIVAPLARCKPGWAARLPYHAYLSAICRFPWREIHHIVYDQWAAPVAHYVRREEVVDWLTCAGLQEVAVHAVNGNSWCGLGIRLALAMAER